MSTVIVGPSAKVGGTPIGQKVLFPYSYPDQFELNGEHFIRSGKAVSAETADSDLSKMSKYGRSVTPVDIAAQVGTLGTIVRNAQGISTGTTVLIGATSGVLRSVDHGKTWTKITVSAISANAMYGLAGDGNGVWLGLANGVAYRSVDDGLTWTAVTTGALASQVENRFCYLGNNTWVVGAGAGIRRSADNGVTWSNVIAITNLISANNIRALYAGKNGVAMLQASDSTVGCLVYFRTSDYGLTWSAGRYLSGEAAATNTREQNYERAAHAGTIAFGDDGTAIAIRLRSHPTEENGEQGPMTRSIWFSRDAGLTFQPLTLADAGFGLSSAETQGSVSFVTYVGENIFLLGGDDNNDNGSQRSALYIHSIDLSQSTPVTRQVVPSYGNGLAQGSSGDAPHSAIAVFNPALKQVFVGIHGIGNWVANINETLQNGVLQTAYIGSGVGYANALVYYIRYK